MVAKVRPSLVEDLRIHQVAVDHQMEEVLATIDKFPAERELENLHARGIPIPIGGPPNGGG